MKYILHRAALLGLAVLLLAGCDVVDYTNPNAATEDQVLASTDGLLALAVGARKEYSVDGTSCLYNAAVADALTTRGLYVINTGNGNLAAIETGAGTLGGANSIITNLWTSCNLTRRDGQLLIDNASVVGDAATRQSLTGYGHFMRGISLGTLATFFQQAPTETITSADYLGGRRPTFRPRAEVLAEAIAALEQAATLYAGAGVPSAGFTGKVGSAINVRNAALALQARYHLMLGNYAAAIAAAQAVDLASTSTWTYDALSPNPMYRSGLVTANVVGGLPDFGVPAALAPEAGDGRVDFFLSNPVATVLVSGFYTDDAAPIPVYLPDEVRLILAEAYARQGDLGQALQWLNEVRTDTDDVFGVNAGLDPLAAGASQQEILAEIYRNRLFELYLLGLRLDDSRRFERPGLESPTPERTRNFYPFPQVERDNNDQTPADPSGPLY